jgi:hypothetical protein
MLQTRTVNDDKITDAISEHDHGGAVIYNNGSTNVLVNLDNLKKPMKCDILILGTGTVTFLAGPTAYLNGSLYGEVNTCQTDVQYTLSCLINPANNNARWYLK